MWLDSEKKLDEAVKFLFRLMTVIVGAGMAAILTVTVIKFVMRLVE